MTSLTSESLARLNQVTTAVDDLFRTAAAPADRAARLADLMRNLWPTAPLTACLVRTDAGMATVVLDAAGQHHPDLAAAVAAGELGESPGERTLAGRRLLVAPAVYGDRNLGVLAVAAPADGDAAVTPGLRAALDVCARQLALHLAMDELRDRLADETALATIGELAGPVVHEFNNLLNTMLLQVAVMEQKVDAELLPDLQTIRRQGASVTTLVRQWQQCRRRPPDAAAPTLDVNAIVEQAVSEIRRQRGATTGETALKLAPDLPPVRGQASELRRLVKLLLNHALAVSNVGATVVTESAGEAVVLRVEDAGPDIPATALPRLFDPLGESRPGTTRLELAACRTLVRRFQGKLRAEGRPGGGITVVFELPAARG